MFKNGDLFAWHLALEAMPLFETFPILDMLGEPAPYTETVADIASFHAVLNGIPRQLGANEFNAVYETGLIYVCVRNIAMAASWLLCPHPDFSRYSPFHLQFP
jgi:hypothetical protein